MKGGLGGEGAEKTGPPKPESFLVGEYRMWPEALGDEWTVDRVDWIRTTCPGCKSRVRLTLTLGGMPWAFACVFCKHLDVLKGSERKPLAVLRGERDPEAPTSGSRSNGEGVTRERLDVQVRRFADRCQVELRRYRDQGVEVVTYQIDSESYEVLTVGVAPDGTILVNRSTPTRKPDGGLPAVEPGDDDPDQEVTD